MEKPKCRPSVEIFVGYRCAQSNLRTRSDVKIIKNYTHALLIIDKTKLLQILVNLICNALDSLSAVKHVDPKIIEITIKELKGYVDVKIKDNGVGVSEDALAKIFSMGYTTKRGHHGFGLHSSVIAANELGGSLHVESAGEGKGAVFTLRLKSDKS